MHHHKTIAVLAAAGALAVPAAAQAHVTLQPKTAVAGSYTVLDVRVPNERDNASTVKVDVQFPDGFPAASYQPVSGWNVKVIKKQLAKPIQTDDGPITEGVDRMIWTGSGKGLGKIGPGQFMDLPISVQIPGKAGTTLTFKALQTYSNGEIVRWIGAPNSDTPAPQVKVTAASAAAATHTGATAPVAGAGDDGGPSPIAWLLAGLGVLAAVAAVVITRGRGGNVRRGASR
jgi:periplasmic copper chaperone A